VPNREAVFKSWDGKRSNAQDGHTGKDGKFQWLKEGISSKMGGTLVGNGKGGAEGRMVLVIMQ